MTSNDKKRKTMIILKILGVVAAIGAYFLFTYWHPFWRYQPGYVSEAQFGDMLLETRAGIFGLTSHATAMGYMSLEDSSIWKWDPNGWNHRVPADKFWIYVNTLCR
jgi:hypothetical protein